MYVQNRGINITVKQRLQNFERSATCPNLLIFAYMRQYQGSADISTIILGQIFNNEIFYYSHPADAV